MLIAVPGVICQHMTRLASFVLVCHAHAASHNNWDQPCTCALHYVAMLLLPAVMLQAQRPSPAVAEAQRQAQLSPLLPLLPEGPQALLGAYRQAAMAFQLHKVRSRVAAHSSQVTMSGAR